MKTILFLTILTQLALPQNGKMLLLFDDDEVQRLTITANTINYKIDDGTSNYYFQVAGVAGKKFKVDWGDGTTSEITFTGITTNQRIAKTYASAGTYSVEITGWKYVTQLTWKGWNAGAFSLQSLPSGLTYLYLYNLGTNFTGSINSLPSGLTFLSLSVIGTNLTGSISNLPAGLTYLYLYNLGTNLTGSISNLPAGLTYLYLRDLGTNFTGSIGSLNANITTMYMSTSGSNFDLTTSLKAFNSANITITPQTGEGYTTAEIDAFLIAYDAVAGTATRTIDLRGSNQPRSAASDAAVISLTAKGRTILTNP